MTPYSNLNVKLAVKVLSSTANKTMTSYGPPEAADTAKFCLIMVSFFDIMKIRNIRNIQSHEFKRKPFMAPFNSVNDDQFGWLQNFFLKYFEGWLTSIEQRSPNFSRNARSNVYLLANIWGSENYSLFDHRSCKLFLKR